MRCCFGLLYATSKYLMPTFDWLFSVSMYYVRGDTTPVPANFLTEISNIYSNRPVKTLEQGLTKYYLVHSSNNAEF